MGKNHSSKKELYKLRKTARAINNLIFDFNYECARKELFRVSDKIYSNDDLFHAQLHLLLYDHKYEEAYELLDYINSEYSIIVKAIVLIKLNKLDELIIHYYKYLYDYEYKKSETSNFNAIKMIVERVLGLPLSEDIKYGNYFGYQICNYNLEDMFKHVFARHVVGGDDKYDLKFEERTKFRDDVDLRKIYDDIKNLIDKHPEDARLITNKLTDKYLIKMPGYADDDNLMYIQVHAYFHNNEIYTFYPSKETTIPIIEVEKQEVYIGNKVKRLSQIEKFNKRYKMQ